MSLVYSSEADAPVDVQVCLNAGVADEPRAMLKEHLEQALQSTLRFRARVSLIEPQDFNLEYGRTGKAKLVRTVSRRGGT